MPAQETQQTPNPGVSVQVPDIITRLNTDTGPQANATSFGPNLNGLAEGLDQAYGSAYRGAREQQPIQRAKDELWAADQHAKVTGTWSGALDQARLSGQPYDPAQFQTDYQKDVDAAAAKAPSEYAKIAFQMKASQSGLQMFKQDQGAVAAYQMEQSKAQLKNVYNEPLMSFVKGNTSLDAAAAAITSIHNNIGQNLVPESQSMADQAHADLIGHAIVKNTAAQGPGPTALALRGGFGGAALQPVQREIVATSLDNKQANDIATWQMTAKQQADDAAQKAAAGQPVTPQEQHQIATNLASANNATTVDAKTPNLTDFVTSRLDHYSALESKAIGPYAKDQLGAIRQMETMDLSSLTTQRLAAMPPDQQRLQVQELENALGPKNPVVHQAAMIANENIKRLTPGKTYDPVSVASQMPDVAQSLDQATQSLANAVQLPDSPQKAQALGAASDQMNTAMARSFSVQNKLGIPQGQERVLTRDQAMEFSSRLDNPDTAQDTFQQLGGMFGDKYGKRALQEAINFNPKISGGLMLATMNPDNQFLWAANGFKSEKLEKSDPASKAIESELTTNKTWTGYWDANKNDLGSADRRQSMETSMTGMAQFYMKQYNMKPDDAVNKIINDTVGNAYHVTSGGQGNNIAFPKEYVQSDEEAHDYFNKANMAVSKLIDTHGVASSNEIIQGVNARTAMSKGYWSYDAQNNAMAFMVDDPKGVHVVQLGNGQPLMMSMDGLKSAAVTTTPVQGKSRKVSTQALSVDPSSLLQPLAPHPNNGPMLHTSQEEPGEEIKGNFKTTHYGYADDPYGDSETRAGQGAHGNLAPGDVALSDSMAARINAKPNDIIEATDEQGNSKKFRFRDRAPEKDDRFDVYDPEGSEAAGTPFNAVSLKRLGPS